MIDTIQIFKLLSDETRLRMLLLLKATDLCVCELSGILEAPQPRISKNLSKFRDLNLVTLRREDQYIIYQLQTENPLLHLILDHLKEASLPTSVFIQDAAGIPNKQQFRNV